MIWLPVLVLLSAVNAITTPTPASAEPIATTIASSNINIISSSSSSSSSRNSSNNNSRLADFENTTGDNSRIGVPDEQNPQESHAVADGSLSAPGPTRPGANSHYLQSNEQPSARLANLDTSNISDNTAATTTTTTTTTTTKQELHHIGQLLSQQDQISNTSSISDESNNKHHDDKQELTTENKQQKQQMVYTNQFVIEVKGGEEEARRLAKKHGFIYLNHILGDYYHLEHRRLAKRSADLSDMNELDTTIEEEPHVLNIERQVLKRRVKRDFIDFGGQTTGEAAAAAAAAAAASHLSGERTMSAAGTRAQQLPPGSGQFGINAMGGTANQRPMQMLRPNGSAGRPAQFLRPANQAPAITGAGPQLTFGVVHLDNSGHATGQQQPQPQHQRQHGLMMNNGRVDGITGMPSMRLTAAQQQYFDQLEMNSSGPAPFFLHSTNFSSANGAAAAPAPASSAVQTNSNSNNNNSNNNNNNNKNNVIIKHRPPPPPIQMSATSSNYYQRQHQQPSNTSAPFQYANETYKQTAAPFNDPSWPLMWYLDGGARNGFDLNVQAAWKMGYTGKGIVITILDDGLEKDHPDLQANYDPLASIDINGNDDDPTPRYDPEDHNRHGTRCAGEVAAVPDNQICSIGIAYNAKVGGVRMLDGDVTDAIEGRSLAHNNQHVHIYSASWGPDDNGSTVDGPGPHATRAFIDGVVNGRQGLGSIFVFASGNGGLVFDNCNCDGYTNSIWTLSISSASENGYVPYYTETCSSTLASTYSSGSYDERQIVTTDIRNSCTNNHTGTSASAPIAAGICALVLESNPRLTWRDMQHIVVRTAKPANLIARDWRPNGLGRNVSHAFGYGLMDAAAMIQLARRWTRVPEQQACKISANIKEPKFIPARNSIELKMHVNCTNVTYLEHVQSNLTLTASRRGDLHIYLTSPLGTRSTLLAQRPNDKAEQGFRNWPFMTVHSWGEQPNGYWTLEVHNDGKPTSRASLKEWSLKLYGTNEDPNRHLDSGANTVRAGAGGAGAGLSMAAHQAPNTPTQTPTTFAQPKLSEQQQQQSGATTRLPPPPPQVPSRLPSGPPAPSFAPSATNGNGNGNTDRVTTTTAATPASSSQPKRPPPLAQQQFGSGSGSAPASPSQLPPPISSAGAAAPAASTDKSQQQQQPKLVAATVTPSSGGEPTTTSTTTTTTLQTPTTLASVQQASAPTYSSGGQQRPGEASIVQYERPHDGKDPNKPLAPLRADFEIVSAPSGGGGASGPAIQSTSFYNNNNNNNGGRGGGGGGLQTSSSDSNGPATSVLDANFNSSSQNEFASNYFDNNNKPPVQLIDSNKLDTVNSIAPSTTMKPQSSGADTQQQQQQQQQQNELDANQLDSKLTKDYRSSSSSNGVGLGLGSDQSLRDKHRFKTGGDQHLVSGSGSSPSSSDTFNRQQQQQRDNNSAPANCQTNQLLISLSLIVFVYVQLAHMLTWSGGNQFKKFRLDR